MHFNRLSFRKSEKKMGNVSEELCVYLTMVFSNKRKKGLLIVLSVSVRRQHAYLSKYMTTAHSQRDTQNKQIIFLYSSVFSL